MPSLLRMVGNVLSTIVILPWLLFFPSPALGAVLACFIWIPLGLVLIPLIVAGCILAVPIYLILVIVATVLWLCSGLASLAADPIVRLIEFCMPCVKRGEDEDINDYLLRRERMRSRSSSMVTRPTTPLTPGRHDSTVGGDASSETKDDDDALIMSRDMKPLFVSNPASLPPVMNKRSYSPDTAEARSRRSSFIRSPQEVSSIYKQARPKLRSSSNSFSSTTPASAARIPTQEREDSRLSMSLSDGSRPGDEASSTGVSLGSPWTPSSSRHRSDGHGSVTSSSQTLSQYRSRRSSLNSSTTSLNSMLWVRSEGGKDHRYKSDLVRRDEIKK